MARKVMQRVFEMVDQQDKVDPAILRRILQIEQAYMSNDGKGAKDEIQSVILKAVKESKKA